MAVTSHHHIHDMKRTNHSRTLLDANGLQTVRVKQRTRVVLAFRYMCSDAKKWNDETKAVKLPKLLEGEALASWMEHWSQRMVNAASRLT